MVTTVVLVCVVVVDLTHQPLILLVVHIIAMSRLLQNTQKTISKVIIINHRIPATISYRLHSSIVLDVHTLAQLIFYTIHREVVTSEYYCDQTTIDMPDYLQGRCTASSVAILTRMPYI